MIFIALLFLQATANHFTAFFDAFPPAYSTVEAAVETAVQAAPPAHTAINPVYLPPNAVDPLKLLPNPPAPNSKEEKAEFEYLERLQKTRTQAQCELAASEYKYMEFVTFYQKPHGPLTAEEVNKIAPFMLTVLKDGGTYIGIAKRHWDRPRPYITDTKLNPCINKEESKAYPSGHTVTAQLFGRVLSELFPNRKKAIMDRAHQIAFNRMVGGVHHPSDISAGKTLGNALFNAFQKVKAFREELKAVRAVARSAMESSAKKNKI